MLGPSHYSDMSPEAYERQEADDQERRALEGVNWAEIDWDFFSLDTAPVEEAQVIPWPGSRRSQ